MKRVQLPCATKLRLLLTYNEETGRLHWCKSARRGYKPGDVAGCLNKTTGYTHVVLKKKAYYAHRLIWKIKTGQEPPNFIDHTDGNKANNIWANLRAATPSQNEQNRRLNKNNKSGVKGVHPEGNKWRAIIKKDRVLFDLGRFDSVESAKIEMEAMRQKLHAEFARYI